MNPNNHNHGYIKNKRIDYIDIFRALGIVLMIMGHIGFGDRFDFFIHAFHMPMFFFISGLFYKKTDEKNKYLYKKVKSLLVPYIVFGIIHYIIWIIINHKATNLLNPLISLLFINTDGLPIAGALWFLTALFLTEIIYFYIDKIKNKVIKNIIIAIIAIFGNIATIILPIRLPYGIDIACVGVGLFHLGHLLQKYKKNKIINKILNLNKLEISIGIVMVYFCIFFNSYVNMRRGEYGIIPLFWINALFAIIVGINISKYVDKLIKGSIKKYIISIGMNSIVYVCLNQIIIMLTQNIIYHFLKIEGMDRINILIINFIILILTLIILYIIDLTIQNTKLKTIIGKK